MSSTKQLVYDSTKFEKFKIGDLGIADKIHNDNVAPLIPTAVTLEDQAVFVKLQTPNKKTGLWAVEKSFISTALETHKPFIEMTKITLELLGHLEFVTTCISGGPNPFNLPGSYASEYKNNIAQMSQFITGFEPENLSNNGSTNSPKILPETIFLGRFDENGSSASPNGANSGLFSLDSTTNLIWPQYSDINEFKNEQNQQVQNDTASLDPALKNYIIDARKDSYTEEWDDMKNKNQISINFSQSPSNMKRYFKPLTIQYQNSSTDIDIEEDYDINVSKSLVNNKAFYIVKAALKTSIAANNLNSGQNSNNNSAQTVPDPIPNQSYAKGAKFFFNKTLKVIIKKYIPVLAEFKKRLAKPEDFIGTILLSKMYENFEMFDPLLKNKDKFDEERLKYWTLENKFTLDGITGMNVDKWNLIISVKDGILAINKGTDTNKNDDVAVVKMLSNLMALTTNYLIEISDIFYSFLFGILKIKNIPNAFTTFVTYHPFINLTTKNSLYKFLGAKNQNILTIPMFDKDVVDSDTEKAFKKMIFEFINVFVELSNIITNQTLATPLTI